MRLSYISSSTLSLVGIILLYQLQLLSTRANRQGVDISYNVCVFLCLFLCLYVTDFSAEHQASDVKFCTAVYRRLRQGMPQFGELCSPRSPKLD